VTDQQQTARQESSAVTEQKPLLQVDGIKTYFPITAGVLQRKVGEIKAVDDVSFVVHRGETMGLVGESGSGKTTLGRSILLLERPTSGSINFDGVELTSLPESELRRKRRRIQAIFQDPYSSLNPRMKVADIVAEPMKIHRLADSTDEMHSKVEELLRACGLNPHVASRYPHEFSGGQRQRIGIARALAAEPDFIVADEPVSALDVSIQAQIVNLLQDLQEKFKLTYLFIAHDLSVVRHISDRIAVMYLGRLMEISDREALTKEPLHPYTQALISAVPVPDPIVEAQRQRIILPGTIPSAANPPSGCVFHTRCPIATEECKLKVPPLREVRPSRWVACIHDLAANPTAIGGRT
jgi:oligopeptide transport system ATP-binding protein